MGLRIHALASDLRSGNLLSMLEEEQFGKADSLSFGAAQSDVFGSTRSMRKRNTGRRSTFARQKHQADELDGPEASASSTSGGMEATNNKLRRRIAELEAQLGRVSRQTLTEGAVEKSHKLAALQAVLEDQPKPSAHSDDSDDASATEEQIPGCNKISIPIPQIAVGENEAMSTEDLEWKERCHVMEAELQIARHRAEAAEAEAARVASLAAAGDEAASLAAATALQTANDRADASERLLSNLQERGTAVEAELQAAKDRAGAAEAEVAKAHAEHLALAS